MKFAYSTARKPPIPAIPVAIWTPDLARSVHVATAHIDTACDMTVVPQHVLDPLGLNPSRHISAVGLGSIKSTLPVYIVRLEIQGIGTMLVDVATHVNEPYVLIGRDVLNHLAITLDGPNRTLELH